MFDVVSGRTSFETGLANRKRVTAPRLLHAEGVLEAAVFEPGPWRSTTCPREVPKAGNPLTSLFTIIDRHVIICYSMFEDSYDTSCLCTPEVIPAQDLVEQCWTFCLKMNLCLFSWGIRKSSEESQHHCITVSSFKLSESCFFLHFGQGPDTKPSSNYVWPAHQRVLGLVLSLISMLWECLVNSWQAQRWNSGSCSNLCRFFIICFRTT